jgi:hypothetical protein
MKDEVAADSNIESPETSSLCGKLAKRSLNTAQFMMVTFMAFAMLMVILISGITFEVDTASVSNDQWGC